MIAAQQQRMMMRQAQLEGAYMPVALPAMNQINNLQGFYNGGIASIQQMRYGVPFSQDMFSGGYGFTEGMLSTKWRS